MLHAGVGGLVLRFEESCLCVHTGDVVTEETWCLFPSFPKMEIAVSSGCAMFIWLFGLSTAVIWLGCSWKFIVERMLSVCLCWISMCCSVCSVLWEMEMGFAASLWFQVVAYCAVPLLTWLLLCLLTVLASVVWCESKWSSLAWPNHPTVCSNFISAMPIWLELRRAVWPWVF